MTQFQEMAQLRKLHLPLLTLLFFWLFMFALPGPAHSAPTTAEERSLEDARFLLHEGEIDSAYNKAVSVAAHSEDPLRGEAQAVMAQVLFMRNQKGEAERMLLASLEQAPKNGAVLITLVRLYAASGRANEALKRIAPLAEESPNQAGLQLAYAEALFATGAYDKSLEAATQVLKIHETSVAAMKMLAKSYFAMKRVVTAESILRRALQIKRDPEALVLLAGVRMAQDRMVLARQVLEEATELYPGYVEALTTLGAIYAMVRNWDAALSVLNRSLEIAPSLPETWVNLGVAERGAESFEKAEKSWLHAIELQAKLPLAWYNLGVLYLENPIPGRDRVAQLESSIEAFKSYMGMVNEKEQAEKYIAEASLLLTQEKERRAEALKQAEESPYNDEVEAGEAIEEGLDESGNGESGDSSDSGENQEDGESHDGEGGTDGEGSPLPEENEENEDLEGSF